jgi:ParB-like chromosome segregation protein Spo0J
MSIKWAGTKVIQLDTVKLPVGFAKRKKEPHVKELARSIERGGVISLPVVRAKPRELVAGGDRFAALMLLGITRHEVRLVEGTDQELRILTLEENVRRRRNDDYNALTRELVELTGEQIPE